MNAPSDLTHTDIETMLRLFHGSSVTRDLALELADRDCIASGHRPVREAPIKEEAHDRASAR